MSEVSRIEMEIHRLSAQPRTRVGFLAVCCSVILLSTLKVQMTCAQEPVALNALSQNTSPSTDLKDGIRGTGDQLEFRLQGRLLSGVDKPLIKPSVTIREFSSTLEFAAEVIGDRYEVWLPAKSLRWCSPSLEAKSEDGLRGALSIAKSGLRKAICEGVDITLQQPARSIKVLVKHNDQPVADASIVTHLSNGIYKMTSKSDSRGESIIKLNVDETISAFTAWTDSGLLGGYQFHQKPSRDPQAAEHVIEMVDCQEKKIHVVDDEGSPVSGMRLRLQVATPENYNYFGNPADCDVLSDANGNASYRWFPRLEGAHHYAELADEREWKLQSQRNTDNAVEVVVKKSTARVQVKGEVSRGGQNVCGVVVEAYSFQGETEQLLAIADQHGKFCFDALPNSTYSLFVIDDQWVSEPNVFIPIDPNSGEKNKAYLMAVDGQPVTIQLTSGPDRQPIAGQSVSLASVHRYYWEENGEKRGGTTSRDIFVTTDKNGMATAFVPVGNLSASVYSSSWRAESKAAVTADKEARIELHRAQTTATKLTGQITLAGKGSVDLAKVSLSIHAIDCQTSEDFTPKVSKSGKFTFETRAAAIACLAYSADDQWAAATVIDDLSKPISIELLPTAYLIGQLLNGEGMPNADHRVSAEPMLVNTSLEFATTGFATSKKGKMISTKTDANGIYRLGPLPRLVEIKMWCETAGPAKKSGRTNLGEYFIELDDQRPPQVHRIGPQPNSLSKLTAEERVAKVLRDARLGGFHAMIILADSADKSCSNFVQQNLLDYDANIKVSSYMDLRFDTGAKARENEEEFVKAKNWQLPTVGNVVALALDANSNELGREVFEVAATDAKEKARAFVQKYQQPQVDAKKKWDEAFAQAKKTNRRVWVRISQRYCGPCHLLSAWLDDHSELLEKEFVILKIDDVRDLYGVEIARTVTNGKPFSLPFFAFYSEDQKMLASSVGPLGNIGFMSGFESKRHFRRMLERGKLRLSDEEIDQLVQSLED
jgi:Thioredoxin-like